MFGMQPEVYIFFALIVSLIIGALDTKEEEDFNLVTFILCMIFTPVLGLIYVIIKKIVKSVNRSKE